MTPELMMEASLKDVALNERLVDTQHLIDGLRKVRPPV